MNFKYAIFDLDGTLLESMKQWRKCEVDVLNEYAGGTFDDEEIKLLSKLPYGKMIERVTGAVAKPFDYEYYTETIHAKMKELYVNGSVTPKPFAKEWLSLLKERGVKIAVATATPKELCVPCLEKYGLYQYFDCIYTTDETRTKIYPDIFDKCVETLGGTKAQAMVFEDAYYSAKTLRDNRYRFTAMYDESQTESDSIFLHSNAEVFAENLGVLIEKEKKQFQLELTADFLLSHNDYLVAIHDNPDGDCFGSALGLCRMMKILGKSADIISVCEIPKRLAFLNDKNDVTVYVGKDGFKNALSQKQRCVISLDVASCQLLGCLEEDICPKLELAVDHHNFNTLPVQNKYVDNTAAAVGEIITYLAEILERKTGRILLTREVSDALFAAITSDTGCFKYSNASSDTHAAAGILIRHGANAAAINTRLFDIKTKKQFDVETLACSTVKYYENGRIAIIYLPQYELDKIGACHADTENLSQLARMIEGVQIGVNMYEKENGQFKFSVRGNTDADVSKLCAKFGGGGHSKAAGCTISGSAEQAESEFVKAAAEYLI